MLTLISESSPREALPCLPDPTARGKNAKEDTLQIYVEPGLRYTLPRYAIGDSLKTVHDILSAIAEEDFAIERGLSADMLDLQIDDEVEALRHDRLLISISKFQDRKRMLKVLLRRASRMAEYASPKRRCRRDDVLDVPADSSPNTEDKFSDSAISVMGVNAVASTMCNFGRMETFLSCDGAERLKFDSAGRQPEAATFEAADAAQTTSTT